MGLAGAAVAVGAAGALASGLSGSPSPPTPTDPANTIKQQEAANAQQANLQATLNRPDQTGPTGSIDWTKNADGTWSQKTSLSPYQQQLFNQSQHLASGALKGLNQNPGTLQYGTALPTLQTSVANPGVPVTSLANAGNIQLSADGTPIQSGLNLAGVQGIPQADDAAYQKAVQSVYGQSTSRLDPQWTQQQTQLETQLANQGVPQNSDAWNKAMTQFTQGKNDAYTSALNNAITQGSSVESNLFNMGLSANQAGVSNALNSGNFANSAQQQGFNQSLSNADLNNTGQQQQYNEILGSGTFANSAAGQKLAQTLATAGFGNSAQQQMFSDKQANAALNNSSTQARRSLLESEAGMGSGYSQVSLPGITGTSVSPTDAIGANSLSAQQQMAEYQAQMQQQAAKQGGTGSLIGTLGSAAILSDRRVKRDIQVIGKTANGLSIYSFRYAWDTKRQVGLMAQDVEKIAPHAVITSGGIKHVDYGQALAA